VAIVVDPEERELEALRGLVAFRGLDVLDVGCGEGRTAHRIARTAASVLGIDPDRERIARAAAAPPEDRACEPVFRAVDVVGLDLPAARFDVVVFTRSL